MVCGAGTFGAGEGGSGYGDSINLRGYSASSDITRKLLDWHPAQPGLIADLDAGHYFKAAAH